MLCPLKGITITNAVIFTIRAIPVLSRLLRLLLCVAVLFLSFPDGSVGQLSFPHNSRVVSGINSAVSTLRPKPFMNRENRRTVAQVLRDLLIDGNQSEETYEVRNTVEVGWYGFAGQVERSISGTSINILSWHRKSMRQTVRSD